VDYVKGVLSGIAGILFALIGPGLANALSGISAEKATGLAAVAGGFAEAFFSPMFWVLAFLAAALLWAASRLNSKVLRIILFWTPTILITTIGFALFALLLYAFVQLRRS
jgi:hypothetical protein